MLFSYMYIENAFLINKYNFELSKTLFKKAAKHHDNMIPKNKFFFSFSIFLVLLWLDK